MQTGRSEIAWNCVDRLCKMYDRVFGWWRTAVNAWPDEVFVVMAGEYSSTYIQSIHPTLREAMSSCHEVRTWEKRVTPGQKEDGTKVEFEVWYPECREELVDNGYRKWTRRIPLYDSDAYIEVFPFSCPFPEWREKPARMIDQRDDPSVPKDASGSPDQQPPIGWGP